MNALDNSGSLEGLTDDENSESEVAGLFADYSEEKIEGLKKINKCLELSEYRREDVREQIGCIKTIKNCDK